MKIALAMIVKGSDAEAKLLDRALENIKPHVDGIFITATHFPGEAPNKKVHTVAKKHGAVVSDFEWINDFAAARNYNELDADDRFEVCTRKTWDEDINTWTTTYNMLDPERRPIPIRLSDVGTCNDPATERYHTM